MNKTEIFKKTPKQKEAIDLLASPAKNVMLYGGSRSGKSFIALYTLFVRAGKMKSRHVCLRLRFNHIRTSLWMDTARKVHSLCFPDCGAEFVEKDTFIRFPNGSEIWFAGLDDKQRTEKILGKEYSSIFFNECSQLDLSSINIAKTRLAEKNLLKKLCIYDQNPPNKRHWAYHVFERHWDPLAEDAIEKADYPTILMNPEDNLENIDEDYLKMLEKLPQKERDRFLKGLYTDADDGQVYYLFDQDKHVKDFKIPKGTTFVGQDFNVDPGSAVLCKVADDKLWVYDEVFLRNSDTYKMAKGISEKVRRAAQDIKDARTMQVRIAPDSTGKNRKTSGKSDFQILEEKFGSNAILPTRNPYVTDRVNNVQRLLEEGRIIIHPRAKKLINDLEKVFWKDNKLDQKTDPLLTHISDALGYLCHEIMPFAEVYETPIRML